MVTRRIAIVVVIVAAHAARADEPHVAPPEVIEMHGTAPVVVPARPTFDVRRVPPYSDRAILGDYWASAWLLLDVDARGVVRRVKMLARAGYDLDAIGVDYALALRFEPTHVDGRPVESYVVWRLEWPSYYWMIARFGNALRVNPAKLPPCGDGGPIDFDGRPPTRRICGSYDRATLERAPWLPAPRKR